MQIINLTVTNQTITPDCINRVVVAGAKDLVYAQLSLEAEWSGLTVVALFSNDFYNNGQVVEQLWTGEPVEIPPEVLVTGRLRIGLNGFGADGSLMLPTVYMQNGIRVYRNGGLVAMQPETTTPALWEQILAAMGRLSDLNTTDKSTLVAAINEVLSTAGTGGGGAIDPDAIAQAVEDYMAANPIQETDPTVPAWAKAPEKPTYTAEEVHALPDTYTPPVDAALSEASTNPVQNKIVAAKLSEVEAIAKGRATGYVFDTETDMRTWIAANASVLNLGDNLYIRATDVPDYWWDGTADQPLETQKVDLTEYAKKSEVPAIDSTLTQPGQAADAAKVGEEINSLSGKKVSLPKDTDGNVIPGTVGWYAVSDGAGGITWVESAPSGGGDIETTTHGIVWDLVNVTSSNNTVSVSDGASLVAVLTAADGYTLGDVTITMGGEVVTGAWNADTATVTIASVTGDVVISCAGTEITGPVDTTAVIAQEGYGISSSGGANYAKEGYGITKVYEFAYDVDALKQSPKYDAANDYLTGPAMGGFIVSITNTNFLANGGDNTGNSYFTKHRFTADGTYIDYASNPASGGKIAIPQKNSTILNAGVVGVEFSIPLADVDDAYAYWCTPNAAACASIFPNGYREGDIIFAGKNTEYYGMANIDGTLAGGDTAAAELSYDDDVAQNYAVATASILGDDTATDTNTAYGISSSLSAVIDEVRKAWMIEYGGDYRKIPIIISTDQHGRRNSGIFNMLGKTLSLHDVSKIMNLGDTVAVEWNDADSENPLLSCAALENWCESIKAIPFSKRLDVYGNHDSWYYDGYSVDGNPIGTRYPPTMHHLDQYFRNIYARRNNNHGWGAIYDDYFNVKYVIVTGFEYKDGASTSRISTAQMTWIISELEKNDGYDVVIISHIPLRVDPSQMIFPTADSYEDGVYHLSSIDTDAMFAARKTGGTGTITDSDGVEHTYDFSGCENTVLCSLHGHTHEDAYLYLNNELLVNAFDWFDGNTIFFVLIDRVDRQLNIWKVEGDALTYQNYQIPLDKPTD